MKFVVRIINKHSYGELGSGMASADTPHIFLILSDVQPEIETRAFNKTIVAQIYQKVLK